MAGINWNSALQQQEINDSVQPVVSRPSFTRSEGTGVLHINMNSHDNQGTIIGIPIFDLCEPIPHFYFYDVLMEVKSYWKNQKNEPSESNRRLLSIGNYDLTDQAKIDEYNQLKELFTSIYQNRDMLKKTDWDGAIYQKTFFGMYMWVISHTNTNGVQIVDPSTNIPHRGAQGEGQLAFVQFGGKGFEMWNNFKKGFAAMGQTDAQFMPRIFSDMNTNERHGWRSSALLITYQQGADQKFMGSIQEKSFADQAGLAGMVNNRAANASAYMLLPEWIEKAIDLRKEFINTDAPVLFEDAHVNDFRRALKAINNSFDYYQYVQGDTPQGKELYEKYVAEYKYNESDQQSAAQSIQATTSQPAAGLTPGSIPPPPTNGQPAIPQPGIPTPPPATGTPVMPQVPPAPQPGIVMPGQVTPPQPGVAMPSQPVIPGGNLSQPGVNPGVTPPPTIPQPGVGAQPGVIPGQVPPVVPGVPPTWNPGTPQ